MDRLGGPLAHLTRLFSYFILQRSNVRLRMLERTRAEAEHRRSQTYCLKENREALRRLKVNFSESIAAGAGHFENLWWFFFLFLSSFYYQKSYSKLFLVNLGTILRRQKIRSKVYIKNEKIINKLFECKNGNCFVHNFSFVAYRKVKRLWQRIGRQSRSPRPIERYHNMQRDRRRHQ